MRNLALYALVALGVYLSYQVLSPFFVALTWAVLFAILFRGLQDALARRMSAGRAAIIATLVVAAVIVVPFVLLLSAVARQAPAAIASVQAAAHTAPQQLQNAWNELRAHVPVAMPADPAEVVATATQRAVAYIEPRASSIVGGVLGVLGTLASMLFALFFLLRDGPALTRQLRERLPLADDENERLMSDTRDLVVASVGAGVVVAAAQGTIGALAFWALGLGAPLFWGSAIAFCSLLPVVGSTIVWVPAGIWLLLSGAVGRGIAMLLVGTFGISLIDNVLRPLLLTGRTSISGLVIFFGLLGGAAAFGFLGIVIGPIILVTTMRLLEALRQPNGVEEKAGGERLATLSPGAQAG